MVYASFEHIGNSGILSVTTHFGHKYHVACSKQDSQLFRLGGTAINAAVQYEGLILKIVDDTAKFRAFISEEKYFDAIGFLSPEIWDEADYHCYITEYYPLDAENKPSSWIISKYPLIDANQLFVNLDVIDGGNNIIKRYRASPFFAKNIEI